MLEKKTPVPTGNQFQSCIGMLNFISCVYIYRKFRGEINTNQRIFL